MHKITGIMTAAAAAALLSISPVAAQTAPGSDTAGATGAGTAGPSGTGAGVEERLDITQDQRLEAREWFTNMGPTPVSVAFDPVIGEPVPETVRSQLQPVPQEIVTVAPATEGYHYFAMADGRIALVDAETHVVVDFIE